MRALFAPYGFVETVRMRSIAIAKPMPRRAGVLSQQFHPQRDTCNGKRECIGVAVFACLCVCVRMRSIAIAKPMPINYLTYYHIIDFSYNKPQHTNTPKQIIHTIIIC